MLDLGFSTDGLRLISAGAEGAACIWDSTQGLRLNRLEGDGRPLARAGFSPDGKLAVTMTQAGTARLWDAIRGQVIGELEGRASSRAVPGRVAFAPDGQRIASSMFGVGYGS